MLHERQESALAVRVDRVLANALAEKRIVGAVFLVARGGALITRHAVGLADRDAGIAMRENAVFRYSSLTKPIVAAAALSLVERGVLPLDEPIARWLPNFQPTFDGRPARITVRHLLTHTSGLSYGFLEPREGPYHAANVSDGLDQPGLTLEENLARLAELPLAFAPGAAFLYSLASDVLGGVLSAATHSPLPELLARLVTTPLGLRDAAFFPRDPSALVTPYADARPEPTRIEDGAYVPFLAGGVTFVPSRALDPRSYPSGGVGMVGSAPDFLGFLEAIRTRHDFAPAKLIHEMTRDQIAPLTSAILGDGWGFGFNLAVLRDRKAAQSPMNAGSLRWGGVYGHSWWVDPKAELSAVLLTNTTFEGMAGALRTDLEHAVYGE